jgi:hypothetical protein
VVGLTAAGGSYQKCPPHQTSNDHGSPRYCAQPHFVGGIGSFIHDEQIRTKHATAFTLVLPSATFPDASQVRLFGLYQA